MTRQPARRRRGLLGRRSMRSLAPQGPRRLLVESLEDRVVLAEIHGTKFHDINGNGVRDTTLIAGVDPDVIFIIDISGSTQNSFGGTPVGDLNGDNRSNTILDAEIAAFIALNQQLADQGFGNTADVAVVSFSSVGTIRDMNPAVSGTQNSTHPLTDANNNAQRDVDGVLRSLQYGGNTNYADALQQAINLLTAWGTAPENANVIFLSDGFPTTGGSHADEVATLRTKTNNLRAFGVGTGASLTQLLIIDPGAQIFTSTDQVINVFSGTGPQSIYTEEGLNNWAIQLIDRNPGSSAFGQVIATDITHDIDLDNNGVIDPYKERGLYRFLNVPAGTYEVREVQQAGWMQMLPANNGTYTLTLGAESISTGNDFGNFQLGIVKGQKFNDLNGNGARDAGEPGLNGFTIEVRDAQNAVVRSAVTADIDLDNNSVIDPITERGLYVFNDLLAGGYTIAEVQQSGWTQTTSPLAHSVAIASGSVLTGRNFGNQALATYSIAATNASRAEGQTGSTPFTFTVTRTGSTAAGTVNYAVTGSGAAAASAADFVGALLPSGTVSFADGATSATVTINVQGDTIVEPDEGFTVTLSSPSGGGSIATATATGTILNDDLASLSIGNASVVEGNSGTTTLSFTVTLSNPSVTPVTVNYATANGTATTADNDYVATSGTLTFAPGGPLTQSVSVTVNGDNQVEADETLAVTLSGASGATIGTATATGTITNDDSATLSINSVTHAEGNSGTTPFVFTVTLSNPSASPVTVSYATANGTATTADNDYTAASGTLTFAPGVLTQTVTVNVTGDNQVEANETFTVALSSPTGATIAVGGGTGTGTITNDDSATLSINSVTHAEGNSGTTPFVFTVTLSNPSSSAVTVAYATANGTATTADNDYAAASGTLTFAPGVLTQTVTVNVTGDNQVEPNETFTVALSSPSGATIAAGGGTGTGTITNDDSATLSINSVTLAEGNSGTTPFVFTVTLSNPSSSAVTVAYATANGTATTADNDYAASSGTLTFAPGVLTQTVTVNVTGDNQVEPNETFTVALSSPSGATIAAGGGTGTGTITNDDAATLSINSVTLAEGNSGATPFVFTVTLSNPSSSAVTVAYATANGTATTADNDYAAASGTLTFAPGVLTQTVTVNVTGDNQVEANETFTVALSAPTGATIAAGGGTGTGTITNDDAATLSINSVTLAEGNSGATPFVFTVTLSNPSSSAVTVAYATANGTATTADNDYAAASGTLTFAPGVLTQTVTVNVTGDNQVEANETFTVALSAPSGATIAVGGGTGTGTITNDDAATLSINSVTLAEGNSGTTPFVFTVTLSNPSSSAVTVAYATANGTATTADNDYSAASGTLTFAPGVLTQTVSVNVTGDNKVEANETFTVALSAPTGATIGTGTGTGTITNDDTAVLTINSVSLPEGNSGTTPFVFTVTLSNPSVTPVTVNFATADGTATSADNDFTGGSGTLTFAPGSTSQSISVAVAGDVKVEANETFTVALSAASGATIGGAGTGTGTIVNDDTAVLTINSVSLPEGDSGTTPFVFTVTLSNPSDSPVTVNFATADGTATTADNDYSGGSGTLTFAPGVTSQSVSVSVNGDGVTEADETFTLSLSGAAGASIGTASGTGTILNDDFPSDYGDAPDTYATLSASGGAKHRIVAGLHLGAAVDVDLDGQPSALADGDDNNPTVGPDDEDGVQFVSLVIPGQFANVDVTASAPGILSAWLDFSQDGDWNDANEQIFTDVALVAGVNHLSFAVPAGTALTASGQPTFSRFRFSTASGLAPGGAAVDGEVEDHPVAIVLPSSRFFDFNQGNSGQATSPTQPNYIGVLEDDVYNPALRRYGWNQTMVPTGFMTSGGFDRGPIVNGSTTDPESSLLRDGHFAAAARTFIVDIPNGDYVVNVKLGDLSFARDFINFSAEGQALTPVNLSTPAGRYLHQTLGPGVALPVTVADGQLNLTITDNGGDMFWVINALEITPAPGGAMVFTTTHNNVLADGVTIDTYQVTGATPLSLVTLSASLATVVSADASPYYDGIQVQADASGSFAVQVRRPSGPVLATISALETSAATRGVTTTQYFAPDGYRFDLGTGVATQAGYLSVLASTLYTPQLGYGWTGTGLSGFNRGVLGGTANSALLQDGVFATAAGTFAVDLAPGTYQVTVTVGDTYARDRLNVTIPAGAGSSPSLAAVTNMATAAGQYITRTFTAATNASGHLELRFSDAGGDPYWVANAINVRSAPAPLTVTRTTGGASPVADGVTVDTYQVVGAVAGQTYTIDAGSAAVTTADADTRYVGKQVVASGSTFTFQVRRPFFGDTAVISVDNVTNAESGGMSQAFVEGAGIRLDFNGPSNATQAGYVGVRGTTLFSGGLGYGWQTTTPDFERGTTGYSVSSVGLFRDGAYNSVARTFQVQVAPGGSYDLRVYAGDRGFNRDRIQVSVEGGAPQTILFGVSNVLLANQFASLELLDLVDDGDGVLNITFSDGGGDLYWVINGLDVARSTGVGSQLPGASPQLAATTGSGGALLSVAELDAAHSSAIALWVSAGISDADLARLQSTPLRIAELDTKGALGLAFTEHLPSVLIDNDGGGLGWGTVGATGAGSGSSAGYDLVTVVAHELGHVLGLPDLDLDSTGADVLMNGRLGTGQRRVPAGVGRAASVDAVLADFERPDAGSLGTEAIRDALFARLESARPDILVLAPAMRRRIELERRRLDRDSLDRDPDSLLEDGE